MAHIKLYTRWTMAGVENYTSTAKEHETETDGRAVAVLDRFARMAGGVEKIQLLEGVPTGATLAIFGAVWACELTLDAPLARAPKTLAVLSDILSDIENFNEQDCTLYYYYTRDMGSSSDPYAMHDYACEAVHSGDWGLYESVSEYVQELYSDWEQHPANNYINWDDLAHDLNMGGDIETLETPKGVYIKLG